MGCKPWPPPSSKEFEVKMIVHQINGLDCLIEEEIGNKAMEVQEYARLAIEIKWIGSKVSNHFGLSSFSRRSVRRNFTKEEPVKDGVVVEWNEEFLSVCRFRPRKNASFHTWEVAFTFFNGSNRLQNGNVAVLASGTLDLADLCSKAAQQEHIEVSVPLYISRFNNQRACLLNLSVSFFESKGTQKSSNIVQEPITMKKNELFIKKGLEKLGLYVRRTKNDFPTEKCTNGNDVESIYPLDSDSIDDIDDDDDDDESVRENESEARKSLTYETLAYANHAAQFSYFSSSSSSEDEDFIYYRHRKRTRENCHAIESPTSVLNQSSWHSPIRGILPWRKKKLNHRPNLVKGEPLLKKYYGEGGDDIDFDRRVLCIVDESTFEQCKAEENIHRSPVSEFGDDIFTVGSWEQKDFLSRDGLKKLRTEVFFASIDQRNERAAGESACTALVAVIANWFHYNHNQLPIKSQFDSLISEGSLEWRNLCEYDTYMELFPDKHFDLETIMQANIRNLSVSPEKSFIGFFHPEEIKHEGFDFLEGVMSFDNIWDEIEEGFLISENSSFIYIVSWNDHFFVLKVDPDAYYIIDTLGERLFEGCNKAFILKFDRKSEILKVAGTTETENAGTDIDADNTKSGGDVEVEIVIKKDGDEGEEEKGVICRGKECCKEFIKSFLAEIPIRELQVDLEKGVIPQTQLHKRLQIEFHYTKCLDQKEDSCSRNGLYDNDEGALVLVDGCL